MKYLRVKSAWPTTKPSKLWKNHENEDMDDALTYSAATCKVIFEIGDEIAR